MMNPAIPSTMATRVSPEKLQLLSFRVHSTSEVVALTVELMATGMKEIYF
jgi:hypothetical protein